MRLNLILPVVDPEQIAKPKLCPYEKCSEKPFKMRKEVKKLLGTVNKWRSARPAVRMPEMPADISGVSARGPGWAGVPTGERDGGDVGSARAESYGAVALMMEALGGIFEQNQRVSGRTGCRRSHSGDETP